MRLPSLGNIVAVAQQSARRFPLVMIAGAASAYAGIMLIESDGGQREFERLLYAASLGLPLFFALTVLAERASAAAVRWIPPGTGVLVLAGAWAVWPQWTSTMQGVRFIQLALAFLLFSAFAPFAGRSEPNAFWQYNKAIFLRFITAALYTAVLWMGLSGALLATDKLFGVDVPSEGYGRLWMVFAFFVQPWLFVSGVPRDIASLEGETDYPKGLRAFTQYVLLPLVVTYLVILTIYFGKVLVTREWPSGWIGYLVSGVAGVGILAWLLVHPLEERAEHAWVKVFTRGFYLALMPAVVMLWLAIWKRVDQYGVTEARYFLTVLSVWLAGIAVFYSFSRSRNIKLIPVTLCAIAVLTLGGPWSAFAVSKRSQVERLTTTLVRNGLLADGTLRRAAGTVPDADAREISAGFRYLLETHGASSVTPWLSDSLRRAVGAVGGGNRLRAESGARAIVGAMNVAYREHRGDEPATFFRYSSAKRPAAVNIDGFTYAVHLSIGSLRDSVPAAPGVQVTLVENPVAVVVVRDGARVLELPLQPMLDSAAAFRRPQPNTPVPSERLMLRLARGRGAALLVITQVTGNPASPLTLTSLDGELFFRLP